MTELLMLTALMINGLGDDDFRVRQASHETLLMMGPLAYLHVEIATVSKDPEVRKRAEQLQEAMKPRELLVPPGQWPICK